MSGHVRTCRFRPSPPRRQPQEVAHVAEHMAQLHLGDIYFEERSYDKAIELWNAWLLKKG